MDIVKFRSKDSWKANNLRNILAALLNLQTQLSTLFPGWAETLSVEIKLIEKKLKSERKK